MTVLAFAPSHNRPGVNPRTGKPWADATGAFIPEARAFVKLHGGKVVFFDPRKPEILRFQEILQGLRGQSVDCVAFFCHGFRAGLQCGARTHNVSTLADAISDTGADVVALYACDAARDPDNDRSDDTVSGPGGEDGFASRLAVKTGIRVDAHATAAHTTKNPYLRRFDGTAIGDWIVDPKSPAWGAWTKRLRADSQFRLGFPLRSREEILRDLVDPS